MTSNHLLIRATKSLLILTPPKWKFYILVIIGKIFALYNHTGSNLRESNTLHFVDPIVFTDMKCQTIFCRRRPSCTFIKLPIDNALNISATLGPLSLLYISRYVAFLHICIYNGGHFFFTEYGRHVLAVFIVDIECRPFLFY